MPPKLSGTFSFFRRGGSVAYAEKNADNSNHELAPTLKLKTDKEIYRPGDSVISTIDIWTPNIVAEVRSSETEDSANDGFSLLVDSLTFEIKGIEKLDIQWFSTPDPMPGSKKQRRGEQVFLDCTTPSLVSKVIVSSGCSRTYMVRAELPKIIPPSYRGTMIRYLYYVRSTLFGRWLALENGHSYKGSKDAIQLEARAPLQIWVTQKANGLLTEEGQVDGIFPTTTIQMDIYWKEKEADCEWARANEVPDGVEEGYDSSRDEISSVSSYNPMKGNIDQVFRNSLSSQPTALKLSNRDAIYLQGERSSIPSYVSLPRLSVSEVLHDPSAVLHGHANFRNNDLYLHTDTDTLSHQKRPIYSSGFLSPSQQRIHPHGHFPDDDKAVPSTPGSMEPVASEGFIRGRSYNIRMDDQVLLRFSPKNSDSTYYFSDMIGGTLTFFHEGSRRCLEVSITLETSETVSQCYVHPSRKNSPTITKVQSDHHEVVADLVQTSFLFSIPMDGPMSFSTPYVSVQWALRFEFFTTPKNVDWTRYEHPLLIEGREKGEWVLPITVHAPLPRTQAAQVRNEKPLSVEAPWLHP